MEGNEKEKEKEKGREKGKEKEKDEKEKEKRREKKNEERNNGDDQKNKRKEKEKDPVIVVATEAQKKAFSYFLNAHRGLDGWEDTLHFLLDKFGIEGPSLVKSGRKKYEDLASVIAKANKIAVFLDFLITRYPGQLFQEANLNDNELILYELYHDVKIYELLTEYSGFYDDEEEDSEPPPFHFDKANHKVKAFVDLMFSCVIPKPTLRPSFEEILQALEEEECGKEKSLPGKPQKFLGFTLEGETMEKREGRPRDTPFGFKKQENRVFEYTDDNRLGGSFGGGFGSSFDGGYDEGGASFGMHVARDDFVGGISLDSKSSRALDFGDIDNFQDYGGYTEDGARTGLTHSDHGLGYSGPGTTWRDTSWSTTSLTRPNSPAPPTWSSAMMRTSAASVNVSSKYVGSDSSREDTSWGHTGFSSFGQPLAQYESLSTREESLGEEPEDVSKFGSTERKKRQFLLDSQSSAPDLGVRKW
eukprot:TRINITY_DN583_c4_g1_i1.p2 TRINITY_DN583_c4_g1~~TRINITY_DN583_c4_g1_i1.p2  ORF type:complete len:473 (-),score=133.89 TRINITY_DN583_c4_g1_i1:184-1602(-)